MAGWKAIPCSKLTMLYPTPPHTIHPPHQIATILEESVIVPGNNIHMHSASGACLWETLTKCLRSDKYPLTWQQHDSCICIHSAHMHVRMYIHMCNHISIMCTSAQVNAQECIWDSLEHTAPASCEWEQAFPVLEIFLLHSVRLRSVPVQYTR